MVEHYNPNLDQPANETIAEINFLISEDKIQITYHTEGKNISSSVREFSKPASTEEKGATLIMTPDMHSTFQVRPPSPCNIGVNFPPLLYKYLKVQQTVSTRTQKVTLVTILCTMEVMMVELYQKCGFSSVKHLLCLFEPQIDLVILLSNRKAPSVFNGSVYFPMGMCKCC